MVAGSADNERRGRVLLVDDDPAYSEYLRRVLSSGGFSVASEPDAECALARVHAEQWDLLITDLQLPGMNGLELLEQVHELVPGLPAAVLTGHASADCTVSALGAAAAEFLQKPVSRSDLVAKAAELIAARSTGPAIPRRPDRTARRGLAARPTLPGARPRGWRDGVAGGTMWPPDGGAGQKIPGGRLAAVPVGVPLPRAAGRRR